MQPTKEKAHIYHQFLDSEGEEELWLVSYADMVTLLFGFFVILFSFSKLDDETFTQMTQKVSEAFKSDEKQKKPESSMGVTGEERQLRAMQMLISMMNLGENMDEAVSKIEKTYAESQKDAATKNVLMEKVITKDQSLAKTAKMDEVFHTVELVLPDHSLFAPGQFTLSVAATRKIKSMAEDLRDVPGLSQIEVSGHTDGRPPSGQSPYKNNLALSSLRAGAVAEVLIRAGVDPKKLSVRGMGNLQPILPERAADGRPLPENMAKNRRVTILLKMKGAHDPLSH